MLGIATLAFDVPVVAQMFVSLVMAERESQSRLRARNESEPLQGRCEIKDTHNPLIQCYVTQIEDGICRTIIRRKGS